MEQFIQDIIAEINLPFVSREQKDAYIAYTYDGTAEIMTHEEIMSQLKEDGLY